MFPHFLVIAFLYATKSIWTKYIVFTTTLFSYKLQKCSTSKLTGILFTQNCSNSLHFVFKNVVVFYISKISACGLCVILHNPFDIFSRLFISFTFHTRCNKKAYQDFLWELPLAQRAGRCLVYLPRINLILICAVNIKFLCAFLFFFVEITSFELSPL